MSGSDAIAFHELVARVEALEQELTRLRAAVTEAAAPGAGSAEVVQALRSWVGAPNDMMDELGMPPETSETPKKGRDAG